MVSFVSQIVVVLVNRVLSDGSVNSPHISRRNFPQKPIVIIVHENDKRTYKIQVTWRFSMDHHVFPSQNSAVWASTNVTSLLLTVTRFHSYIAVGILSKKKPTVVIFHGIKCGSRYVHPTTTWPVSPLLDFLDSLVTLKQVVSLNYYAFSFLWIWS